MAPPSGGPTLGRQVAPAAESTAHGTPSPEPLTPVATRRAETAASRAAASRAERARADAGTAGDAADRDDVLRLDRRAVDFARAPRMPGSAAPFSASTLSVAPAAIAVERAGAHEPHNHDIRVRGPRAARDDGRGEQPAGGSAPSRATTSAAAATDRGSPGDAPGRGPARPAPLRRALAADAIGDGTANGKRSTSYMAGTLGLAVTADLPTAPRFAVSAPNGASPVATTSQPTAPPAAPVDEAVRLAGGAAAAGRHAEPGSDGDPRSMTTPTVRLSPGDFAALISRQTATPDGTSGAAFAANGGAAAGAPMGPATFAGGGNAAAPNEPAPASAPTGHRPAPPIDASVRRDTTQSSGRPTGVGGSEAERFMAALGGSRPTLSSLPARYQSLARAIVGRAPVMATGSASRRALAAVGKPAATIGSTIYLPDAPRGDARTLEMLAHEFAHAADAPVRPAFFGGHDDPGERHAGDVGRRVMAAAGRFGTERVLRAPAMALRRATPASDDHAGHGHGNGAGSFAAEAAVRRATGVAPGSPQPGPAARSTTSSLPVGGLGSAVAAVAAVGDVAARAATEAVQRSTAIQRAVESGGEGGGRDTVVVQRQPDAVVQRVAGEDLVGSGGDEESQREKWLDFAASEEFTAQLMESIEDRLMDAIERRGGRYGGWFA